MKFTQIPVDTFQKLQMNAGILVDTFEPTTGEIGNLLGATSGGINFTAAPTFSDKGEDIDNAPKNTKELKSLDSWEVTMAGTILTVTPATAKRLSASADIDSDDETHVIPRNDLKDDDFEDFWWVGDYSNLNGERNGGFCAIHIMNALSTGGFQIQTGDKAKGQFPFTFTGHYSITDPTKVPFEIYVKAGTEETVADVTE